MTRQRSSKLLTATEAARYLKVSDHVLQAAQRSGELQPYRTPGGHRKYTIRMLNEYLEKSRR